MKNSTPTYRTTIILISTIILSAIRLFGGEISIIVENPSANHRNGEPVVIVWEVLSERMRALETEKLRLLDDRHRSIPFQIDDLDGDGNPDEFVFTADLLPNQQRRFLLTDTADSLALPTGPYRTDAVNYKRVDGIAQFIDDDDGPGTFRNQNLYPFDGVGWESELIGYRLYLDERNAIDIQGKRLPGLHWRYIAESRPNYQLDAYWGMDVLHVGPALGHGGIGVWDDGAVVYPKELDKRRCRVIARGPVRAVVRVDYSGWSLSREKIDLSSIFIIYGGDRITEHRVILRSGSSPVHLATGIVKHEGVPEVWDPSGAALHTSGEQSRSGEKLLMALAFDSSSILQRTEDVTNHLAILDLEKDVPLRYLISAFWQGESGIEWNDTDTNRLLEKMVQWLNEPLVIRL